jgi:hypothetical protein
MTYVPPNSGDPNLLHADAWRAVCNYLHARTKEDFESELLASSEILKQLEIHGQFCALITENKVMTFKLDKTHGYGFRTEEFVFANLVVNE